MLSAIEALRGHLRGLASQAADPRQAIRHAILTLPFAYREPVILAHLGGFSYCEMAQVLSVPSGRSCGVCSGSPDATSLLRRAEAGGRECVRFALHAAVDLTGGIEGSRHQAPARHPVPRP